MNRSRPGFILLRRCALGLWLCAIALLGVVEFRRAVQVDAAFVLGTTAWLWLIGSTATGVVGVALLVRELRRHRSERTADDRTRMSSGM